MLAQAGALLGVKRASRSFVKQVPGGRFLLLYAALLALFGKLGLFLLFVIAHFWRMYRVFGPK